MKNKFLLVFLLMLFFSYNASAEWTDLPFHEGNGASYMVHGKYVYGINGDGIEIVSIEQRKVECSIDALQCADAGLICDSPFNSITWLQGDKAPLLCDWPKGKVFAISDGNVTLKAEFTPFEEQYDHLIAGAYTGDEIYAAVCGDEDLTYEHRVYRVPLNGEAAQLLDWERVETLVPLADGKLILQQVGYHREELDDFAFWLFDDNTQQMEKLAVLNDTLAWGIASAGDTFCIVQDDMLTRWNGDAWGKIAQAPPKGENWLIASGSENWYAIFNVFEKKLTAYPLP